MTYTIFCPNDHLLLQAPLCPECGWKRPASSHLGGMAWGPVDLGAELGGPGRNVLARGAISQGVAAFPLNNGELVGLDLTSGRLRWRTPLGLGLQGRSLHPAGRRLLASLSDMRPMQQAACGQLAAINPLDGELTTLWQADSHQVSPLWLDDNSLVLRTSDGKALCFDRQPELRLRWQAPLRSWWPLPPFQADDLVFFSDGDPLRSDISLQALQLADGEPAWQVNLQNSLSTSPVSCQGKLVLVNGNKQLQAYHLDGSGLLWEKTFPRFYGQLCAGSNQVYLSVRGNSPAGVFGHYQLLALDAKDGNIAWQVELPPHTRLRSGPVLLDENLVFSSDDGYLMAYDAANGEQAWQTVLGNDENPPRSELLFSQGVLLAGTASGQVYAIQAASLPEKPCDPEILKERGDWEGAAVSLALCGDLVAAAEIYREQLKAPRKALALLEHAQAYEMAGDLAAEQEWFSQARQNYQKGELSLKEAQALVSMGDHLGAARVYESQDEKRLAAGQYEQANELRKALKLYQQLRSLDDMYRLRQQVPFDLNDIETLEEQGNLLEAGEAAMKIGNWSKAEDLFKRSEEPKRQVDALEKMAETQPEDWIWERLAPLARSLGRFDLEAHCWHQLDQPLEEAEAWDHAAQQLENRSPQKAQAIAGLYEKAFQIYEDQGLDTEAAQCRQRVVALRRMPWVIIAHGETEHAFVETVFNTLVISLQNVGKGVAHKVVVRPESDRFELDLQHQALFSEVQHLAPGYEKQITLFIRPLENQVGPIPLVLFWSWKDVQGNEYEEKMSWPVHVTRLAEQSSSATPVEIHYHGTVYQSQQGMEVIEGNKIEGDQIGGDQISGNAQKGDRVEIKRSASETQPITQPIPRQKAAPEVKRTLCPNCGLQVSAEYDYCNICGASLHKEAVADDEQSDDQEEGKQDE